MTRQTSPSAFNSLSRIFKLLPRFLQKWGYTNNWTRLGPIDPIDPTSKTALKPIY